MQGMVEAAFGPALYVLNVEHSIVGVLYAVLFLCSVGHCN